MALLGLANPERRKAFRSLAVQQLFLKVSICAAAPSKESQSLFLSKTTGFVNLLGSFERQIAFSECLIVAHTWASLIY